MSICGQLAEQASAGIAPALRAVDCLASETTSVAFGRLFGSSGALAPALTILLTLYIAFFAITLLTGRGNLGLGALVPRMTTLGLVLTFATSWLAYQSVVWNLATGAPDQIASVMTGTTGSATQIFADRMDMIFAAIAEVASSSGQSAQGAGASVTSGSFTPANVMWLGALVLLLGTVGILVTARIALAVLVAVGPVFVVMALFTGTRGLTAGWLRSVVMTAVTPLYVVVGGSIVMELLVPVIATLRSEEGVTDGRAAMALFLIAAVHMALMVMIGKVTATSVSAWSVFGLANRSEPGATAASGSTAPALADTARPTAPAVAVARSGRIGAVHGVLAADAQGNQQAPDSHTPADRRTIAVVGHAADLPLPLPPRSRRAQGIGSRFSDRRHQTQIKGMIR